MNIFFRAETPADHYTIEALTREAFWSSVEPGNTICNEHLLVYRLRDVPTYVPELNWIAEADGVIAGHIIYTRSKVVHPTGHEWEVLTFGPLSILPAYQRKGIGQALMRHSFEVARHLGFRAVVIYGHESYYPRVGFRPAREYGIVTPKGETEGWFMALPLYDGALDGVTGRHWYDPVYDTLTDQDTLAFDKRFPAKP
jgi:predicted N-acetyltransferase YhbS